MDVADGRGKDTDLLIEGSLGSSWIGFSSTSGSPTSSSDSEEGGESSASLSLSFDDRPRSLFTPDSIALPIRFERLPAVFSVINKTKILHQRKEEEKERKKKEREKK